MRHTRPLECPACGHERIRQRRPLHLRTETGRLRVRLTQWICGLCEYQWTLPVPARAADDGPV